MADRRKSFGPVVLLGLASAALLAVAAAKPWFEAAVDFKMVPGVPEPDRLADSPLALALALVVLAGWGALLVTRARMRRVIAGLALLASLGVAGALVVAPFTLPDQIREQLRLADLAVSPTGWYAAAAAAAPLCLLLTALAVRLAPSWPEMGSRYDAPGASPTEPGNDPRDLWKALDEGSDPTDR